MELNIKKIEAYLESVKMSERQFCIHIGISYSAWNTMKNTKRTSIKSLAIILPIILIAITAVAGWLIFFGFL